MKTRFLLFNVLYERIFCLLCSLIDSLIHLFHKCGLPGLALCSPNSVFSALETATAVSIRLPPHGGHLSFFGGRYNFITGV